MPIYEYACRSCEHQFETIQKASEPVLTDCPECGEAALKKLLSAPVFRLKGNGWYETDFKTGDKKNVSDNGQSDKTESTAAEGKTKGADSADGTAKKAGDSTTKDTQTTDSKSSSSATSNTAKAD
ncbi:MAG: zinc ribbon domain-containing protein [Gammaproteobacteria bacterium]|nr:zinc ribbon domain-containing protein [Gammaproteobacteria bacterium]MYF28621.1 zinc ribbon domain-containing protein [Gammaproteobacteria bacterium]MYK47320.1 zinc ribbon domain-containing protein [Gammaproteobacteria bacterium]